MELAQLKTKPFLKWAGGKTQLLDVLLDSLPNSIGTYYEPFIGGGALFFALAERQKFQYAILNDLNHELTNCYQVIRDNPQAILESLESLQRMPFNQVVFEQIKTQVSEEPVEKAARTIYLNKTCYNGLYRVNQSGHFNVPFGDFGTRIPKIVDTENVLSCSRYLKKASVTQGDFVDCLKETKKGDFVYFDPPYVPLNTTSNFTSYTRDGFSLNDQRRLALCIRELTSKGVKVIASNSDVPIVRDIFDSFDIHPVPVRRPINSVGSKRGIIQEVLIFNFYDAHRVAKLARAFGRIAVKLDYEKRLCDAYSENCIPFLIAMELGD